MPMISRTWLRRVAPGALAIPLIYALSVGGTASAAALAPRPSGYAASAAPKAVVLGNFKVSYSKTWVFKSADIGICVVFTATGNATYTVSYQPNDKFHLRYTWYNQHFNDPTVEADIHAYAGGSCIGPATATGMTLVQSWTGYGCSFNPSLGVSYPWGVTFAFWPSCGNRDQAERHSHYSDTASFYVQHNSGNRVDIGNYSSVPPVDVKPTPPCYGIYVAGEAKEANQSDSYVSGAREVCLSKY